MLQRSALALSVAALLGGAGCIHAKSYISQGQVLTTGNATYDTFFKVVRDLHAQAERAQAEERESHAALIVALKLEPQTSVKVAVSEAGIRAKKIREAGIILHLELVPVQRVITKKDKRDAVLNPEGKDFLRAVEECTKSSLSLSARVGEIAARAAELEKTRVDLRAEAPAAFRTIAESRRDEIIQELDDAAAVLTDAATLGERYAGLASKFAVDLAHALETGVDDAVDDAVRTAAAQPRSAPPQPATAAPMVTAPAPIASAEPAAEPAPPAVAKRPPPVAAAQKRPRRPPAAKPPPAATGKKPKGGDDFEP